MKKIAIYEDSVNAIENRYSSLFGNNEVYVFWMDKQYNVAKSMLSSLGLKETHVFEGLNGNIIDADINFVDGLRGKCIDLLQKLPKEKTYLVTLDESLSWYAKKLGYNTLDESELGYQGKRINELMNCGRVK